MAPPRLTLLGISYSPWTEKARWALDHHRVVHRYKEYTPLLGEIGLRMRLGRLRGTASVPVLLGGPTPVCESAAIARAGEAMGSGSRLFPSDKVDAVERWNANSERALSLGRALAVARMRESPAAKEASLPSFVPGPLRGLLRPIAAIGMAFIARKYRLAAEPGRATLMDLLRSLQTELADGRRYLLGSLSFADIAMASALQFVAPPGDRLLALPPPVRECFTDREVESSFGDVIRWRDWLYENHRAVV